MWRFLDLLSASPIAAIELTTLFRGYCPHGQIIFVTELPGDERCRRK
jgi:hypothetical protein